MNVYLKWVIYVEEMWNYFLNLEQSRLRRDYLWDGHTMLSVRSVNCLLWDALWLWLSSGHLCCLVWPSFFPSLLAKAVHTEEWEPRAVTWTTDCSAKSWPGLRVPYIHLSLAKCPVCHKAVLHHDLRMILWFTQPWFNHSDSSAGIKT